MRRTSEITGASAVAAIIVLLAVASVWAMAGTTIEIPYRGPAISQWPTGPLLPGTHIGQTFVAENDGLSSVEVKLATYYRRNECRVIFRLMDMQANLEVTAVEFPCAEVENNAYRKFSFLQLSASKGRTYMFTLESPDATLENSITAFYASKRADYPEGTFSVNLEPRQGDMVFTTFYGVGLAALVEVYLGRLTEGKPWVFGSEGFYVSLLVAYFLTSLAMLGVVKRARRR